MVSLLLEHGAEVNCRSKNALTPMHLAAQEDRVPAAEVLVKYESEIDAQTKVRCDSSILSSQQIEFRECVYIVYLCFFLYKQKLQS